MNEADIKKYEIEAILVLVESVKADLEAMKIENVTRAQAGESPAYGENYFNEVAETLVSLSDDITNIINRG